MSEWRKSMSGLATRCLIFCAVCATLTVNILPPGALRCFTLVDTGRGLHQFVGLNGLQRAQVIIRRRQ
jgi:hypothetical protein